MTRSTNDLEKLKRFQERFEQAKTSVSRFQGELDGLFKNLKERCGLTSTKQIERKLKQTRKQRGILIEDFNELLSEIEALMEDE